MSVIIRNRVLQKNRAKIANFFSNCDEPANQKMLMDSCFFYFQPYYNNLSLNSKREEIQFYIGKPDNSSNETDDLKPNSSDVSLQASPSLKDSLKQKKSKNESSLYDFNNSYFLKFGQISKVLTKFNRLTYLSLQNCCLCTVPKQLYSLPKDLISLDLSNNCISKIPINVSWKKLKHLNLEGNWIREWPSIFEHEKFDSLEYLNLGKNQIEKVNPNQTPFHNLKTLILSFNFLTQFPVWLKDCPELRFLSIKGNSYISNFDLTSLCVLPNLQFLDLHDVRVNKVPLKMQDSLLILIVSKDLIERIPIGNFQLIC